MRGTINPFRIAEIFTHERVKLAADTLVRYRTREVLVAVVCYWLVFLLMLGSLILTVRAATAFPLYG